MKNDRTYKQRALFPESFTYLSKFDVLTLVGESYNILAFMRSAT